MEQHFQSKRDLWLAVVIWLSAAAMVACTITSISASRWILASALIAGAAGMLWLFYGTHYTIGGNTLVVRSGPLRWSVPLDSITSAEPSRDPSSSPASSLDRIEIRYAGGSKRLLVSPLQKQEFLAALKLAA